MKPNFIIVGSMRSGSTSLSALLNANPNIFIPQKELYFFSFERNYLKGINWYESFFRDVSGHRILGEKCVSYGYVRESRDRILQYNPNVKLIWILREPISRAISHYRHNVNNGIEKRDFRQAISDELNDQTSSIFKMYLNRGRYINEINHFLEVFSSNHIYVLLMEELFQNKSNVFRKLLDDLGTKNSSEDASNYHLNKSKEVLFPRLVRKSIDIFGYGSYVHNGLRQIKRNRKIQIELSKDIYKILTDYFRSSNKSLENFLGRKLDIWHK